MNVYEYGIAGEKDEWGGLLKMVSTTDLPIYSGFTTTIVDHRGNSLNERAVHTGRVNIAYNLADYFEENDLRYCCLATLYHLNRLIDLYVNITELFEKIHPYGTANRGNTADARVFYELDSFLVSARRIYESISKVLWKHYGNPDGNPAKHRWRSIGGALNAEIVPLAFGKELKKSWGLFGEKLTAYRDCLIHNDPLYDGSPTCWMALYGTRWGMTVKLPSNPECKGRRSYDYAAGPETLSYCHSVACHLVGLCEVLYADDKVKYHLDNPTDGKEWKKSNLIRRSAH